MITCEARFTYYGTFKSKNDQQLNQALLGRMKNLVVKGEKKVIPADDLMIKVDPLTSARNLTLQKLSKLVRLHTHDAILWNNMNLCRTFNVPEGYCENLVRYVKPLIFMTDNKHDAPRKLFKTSTVIDVKRLKEDKSYMIDYQNIVYPDVKIDPKHQLAYPESLKLE